MAVYGGIHRKQTGLTDKFDLARNLQSGGISPDSTSTRNILSVSLHLPRLPQKLPSHCNPTWQLFSIFLDILLKVITSCENPLFESAICKKHKESSWDETRLSGAEPCVRQSHSPS